jgi:hypothetical protein
MDPLSGVDPAIKVVLFVVWLAPWWVRSVLLTRDRVDDYRARRGQLRRPDQLARKEPDERDG